MWRLTKKSIALAVAVPAVALLLNPGTANATPITFDFSGQLSGGEILDFSLSFDPLQPLAQIDQFTQTITYTNSILNFNDLQFASTAPGAIFQREGTDGEFFPDLWGFTAVLTEIGGNQDSFTLTVRITDPSLSFIQPGIVVTNSALFLGSGLQPGLFLQGDNISSTGFITAATTSTAVSEPWALFLFAIGLAALGLAARRRAS